MPRFVSGPLNANEEQLLTQWAELQECVFAALIISHRHTLKCLKLFCLLCLNRSQTKMERLRRDNM